MNSDKTVAEIWITIPKKIRKDILAFWSGEKLKVTVLKKLNDEQLAMFYFLTDEIKKLEVTK